MNKEVTILIPTRFNNRWVLDLNLRTIRKYTKYPYKIIIGDAGMNIETADFLKTQKDIEIVKCPDPIRPKDYLARAVNTPYFLFLHDDVQIIRAGWLAKRISLIEKNPKNGIVGVLGNNYIYRKGLMKYLNLSPLAKRFLPLAIVDRMFE